jgi:hypothetical protein
MEVTNKYAFCDGVAEWMIAQRGPSHPHGVTRS